MNKRMVKELIEVIFLSPLVLIVIGFYCRFVYKCWLFGWSAWR